MSLLTLETFTTKRLVAERIQAKHFQELCWMHQDAKVMANIGGIRSAHQTQQFLNENLEHWERQGFGLWIFRDKVSSRFVGRAGFRKIYIDKKEEVLLAYSLMSEFWGQGLATEVGEKILELGFKQIGLIEVVGSTIKTNIASQRVMQKLGFQYEKDEVNNAGLHFICYRLKALTN